MNQQISDRIVGGAVKTVEDRIKANPESYLAAPMVLHYYEAQDPQGNLRIFDLYSNIQDGKLVTTVGETRLDALIPTGAESGRDTGTYRHFNFGGRYGTHEDTMKSFAATFGLTDVVKIHETQQQWDMMEYQTDVVIRRLKEKTQS